MGADLLGLATTASPAPPAPAPPPAPRRSRSLLVASIVLLVLIAGSATVLAHIGRPYRASAFLTAASPESASLPAETLRRKAAAAAARLEALRPAGVWIVVDTYANRLRLYNRGELVRDAICSTGTGRVLKDPRNGRTWIFDTPLGERVVNNKVRNPIWAKPDWAFIEEGYLPPPAGSEERFDDISLGGYGLYMGDGYIIHGTLFKTLLGRRVTHGCIRLGDEDLEFVYKNAPIGTRVFLY